MVVLQRNYKTGRRPAPFLWQHRIILACLTLIGIIYLAAWIAMGGTTRSSSFSLTTTTMSHDAAIMTIRCLTTPGCFRSLKCRTGIPQKIQRKKKWEEQSFCVDDLKTKSNNTPQKRNDCLVYSFGIHESWEWEEKVAKLFGCEVHAFDPTQTYPADLAPGVTFHSLGLQGAGTDMTATHGIEYASIRQDKLRPLDDILQMLGHSNRKLDLLMLDCEGCEWGVLKQMWCQDNAKRMPHVDQMVIEMHFQKSLGLATELDIQTAAQAIHCLEQARWGITVMEKSGADRRDSEFYAPDVSKVLQDSPAFLLNAAFQRIPDNEPLPHQIMENLAHHSEVWYTARQKCLLAEKGGNRKIDNTMDSNLEQLCSDFKEKEKTMNKWTEKYNAVVQKRTAFAFDVFERYDEKEKR